MPWGPPGWDEKERAPLPHPLETILITKGNRERAQEYLRALPETTFGTREHVKRYVRGSHVSDSKLGTYGIYAQLAEENTANEQLMIVVQNPHLGDNPLVNITDGPDACFRIPEKATQISFFPARMPPACAELIAGVEFRYEGRTYGFYFGTCEKQRRAVQKGLAHKFSSEAKV